MARYRLVILLLVTMSKKAASWPRCVFQEHTKKTVLSSSALPVNSPLQPLILTL